MQSRSLQSYLFYLVTILFGTSVSRQDHPCVAPLRFSTAGHQAHYVHQQSHSAYSLLHDP